MSNDNIVEFNKPETNEITYEDMDPDKMLRAAIGLLSGCIVIGWTKSKTSEQMNAIAKEPDFEGDSYMYMASSIASGPEVLWLLEKTKSELLNG